MCTICTLALRHQGVKKRDSLLSNRQNLSTFITLNPPTPKSVKSGFAKKDVK